MTPEISKAIADFIGCVGIGLSVAITLWAVNGFPAFWRKSKDE
jgi:hypothetical protein